MLKHIKDIRSPIAVAQQKHAARKASSPDASTLSHGRTPPASSNRARTRPPNGEVGEMTTPNATGSNSQPPWMEVMSPSVESKDNELGTTPTVPNATGGVDNAGHKGPDGREENSRAHVRETLREMPVALSGVSYAVAIYPYMAEQDDEFDVVV
jgi:hypothetical protein